MDGYGSGSVEAAPEAAAGRPARLGAQRGWAPSGPASPWECRASLPRAPRRALRRRVGRVGALLRGHFDHAAIRWHVDWVAKPGEHLAVHHAVPLVSRRPRPVLGHLGATIHAAELARRRAGRRLRQREAVHVGLRHDMRRRLADPALQNAVARVRGGLARGRARARQISAVRHHEMDRHARLRRRPAAGRLHQPGMNALQVLGLEVACHLVHLAL